MIRLTLCQFINTQTRYFLEAMQTKQPKQSNSRQSFLEIMTMDHWTVLLSFSTQKPSFCKSWQMDWKRVSGMWGSLQRIHRQLQFGLLTTEQVQSLSRRTTQQSPEMSSVDTNWTFNFALVFSVSYGSGKAFPIDSDLTPLMKQVLLTRRVPSLFSVQLAVVFSQQISLLKGMTACSYQRPLYFDSSTKGTVLGGSLVKLIAESLSTPASCQARRPTRTGTSMISVFLIK